MSDRWIIVRVGAEDGIVHEPALAGVFKSEERANEFLSSVSTGVPAHIGYAIIKVAPRKKDTK